MSLQNAYPYCDDTRPCFARIKDRKGDGKCRYLTSTYSENGECPFAKPVMNITNGKIYPYKFPTGA